MSPTSRIKRDPLFIDCLSVVSRSMRFSPLIILSFFYSFTFICSQEVIDDEWPIYLPEATADSGNYISGGFIDSSNQYGYYGVSGPSPIVVKVDLTNGKEVSGDGWPLTLSIAEEDLVFSVQFSDSLGQYAYFAAVNTLDPYLTGTIFKIDLLVGKEITDDSWPMAIDTNVPVLGFIDASDDYAYFYTGDSSSLTTTTSLKLMKIDLIKGSEVVIDGWPILIETVPYVTAGCVDSSSQFAYLGTYDKPSQTTEVAKVVKIDLVNGKEVTSDIWPIEIQTSIGTFTSAFIDSEKQFVYFVSANLTAEAPQTTQAIVIKIDLVKGMEVTANGWPILCPTTINSVSMPVFMPGFMDSSNNFLYFALSGPLFELTQVMKIDLINGKQVSGSGWPITIQSELPPIVTSGFIDSLDQYSYFTLTSAVNGSIVKVDMNPENSSTSSENHQKLLRSYKKDMKGIRRNYFSNLFLKEI